MSKFLDAGMREISLGDLVLFRAHGGAHQRGEALGLVQAIFFTEKDSPMISAGPLVWRRDGERMWRRADWLATDAHCSQFRRVTVPQDGAVSYDAGEGEETDDR